MEKLVGKAIAACFAFIVLLFAAYQVIRYMQSPYKTETAFEYAVQDSISAQGIMIRDEVVIKDEKG